MICTKCNNAGILNSAGGNDFWFCTTCRDEIRLETVLPERTMIQLKPGQMALPGGGINKLTGNVTAGPGIGKCYNNYNEILKVIGTKQTLTYIISINIASHSVNYIIPTKVNFTVDDWIPEDAPRPGDNFCGVDRSISPLILAGIRGSNHSSQSVEESIHDLSQVVGYSGGRPDTAALSTKKYQELEVELGNKIQYIQEKSLLNLAIALNVGYGLLRVVKEPNLPDDVGFVLTESTWETVNGVLVCTKPGYNGRIKFV